MKSLKELEFLTRNEIRDYFRITEFSKEELLEFLKLSGIKEGSIKQLTVISERICILLLQK